MQSRSTSKSGPSAGQDQHSYESGETVLVNLELTVGGEIRKTRPCLVIQSAGIHFDLIIVLPITDSEKKHSSSLHVLIADLKLAGLTKPSVIDCFQIRAISCARVIKGLGRIEDEVLGQVRSRLAKILDIGEEHIS